jgi:hypothetical protein
MFGGSVDMISEMHKFGVFTYPRGGPIIVIGNTKFHVHTSAI